MNIHVQVEPYTRSVFVIFFFFFVYALIFELAANPRDYSHKGTIKL